MKQNTNNSRTKIDNGFGWNRLSCVLCLVFVTFFSVAAFAENAVPGEKLSEEATLETTTQTHDSSEEEASEGEAGTSLNPLQSWRADLALWTAIVFLGLVLILGKFAFKPIVNALDARENAMLDKVAAVEKANSDAKELLGQYQEKLANSEAEMRQMLETARSNADKVALGIIEKAKQAAENEHARALKDIEAATDSALQELAAKSAVLATSLAGRIIQEQIDPSKHAQLIEGAMHEFSNN